MFFFKDFHLIKKLLRLTTATVFLLFFLSIHTLSVAGTSCAISFSQRLSTYVNDTVASLLIPGDANEVHGYQVSFLNDRTREITGAAALNVPDFVVPDGLTGEGQIVALADSGLDAGRLDDIHLDLQSVPGQMPKVVLLKSWAGRDIPDDPDGHGTHMAATIAGTGKASNGQFRGVAPGASLYFQAILNKDGEPELPARLEELFWPAYSAGARVHVNGWGAGPDTYLEPAAQVDEFVRNYPDFLVVFGAGNSGPSPGTITTEANSKNALAVGASILPRSAFLPAVDDTALPADFSSRGPAGDGRIKPELLAPASAVISARSRLVEGNLQGYPAYTRMQGTSMAAAVAGGSSALLREYLKENLNMASPSAALAKAALINGSRPAVTGPSRQGFGVIDLAGTLIGLKEDTIHLADETAGITQGNEAVFSFTVDDTAAPFKATLTWTDPPAEPGSANTLVNDLDLMVKTPDGRVYYGNHFLGINAPDRTNNVEQVYLPLSVPGEYTVQVIGASVSQNTVRGSTAAAQDYALAWGQSPVEAMVRQTEGHLVELTGGNSINLLNNPVVNLIDDKIAPVDNEHIFSGTQAYLTPGRTYLFSRLWRAYGVKVLNTSDGSTFMEMNPALRLGGYSLALDSGDLLLNDLPVSSKELPDGFEISAVVNPIDQKIRQVRTSFIEREGVISSVLNNNGQKTITLAGDGDSLRISPGAAYIYEDSYVKAGVMDMPFGIGAMEELEEVLPGMTVLLHLAPSSGDVQYLAVKRQMELGTLEEALSSGNKLKLENGVSYRVFPGAPIKKDTEVSSLDALKPGDHISVTLLPDTGEAIDVVSFSNVFYGKAIGFIRKDRTLYLLDDNDNYRSLYLPPNAVIYRWGVRSTADAIAAGNRIRVTTDPGDKEVWRLDLAETFYERSVLSEYDETSGTIRTWNKKQFRISDKTAFYKNGYPVLLVDLKPGEQVELEYATIPQSVGNVLFSIYASSSAKTPLLLASAFPLQGGLWINGRSATDVKVYAWEGHTKLDVSLNESGRFSLLLPPDGGETKKITLVAVDKQTGGVTGKLLTLTSISTKDVVYKTLYGTRSDSLLSDETNLAGLLVSRAETAVMLERLLNWSVTDSANLPFFDEAEITAIARPAVSEAQTRGIMKGNSEGYFFPMKFLSRAEAAVVFATTLRDLGIENEKKYTSSYTDSDNIPSWAVWAVEETTAAGIFHSDENGLFGSADPVTAGEMKILLDRFLDACTNSAFAFQQSTKKAKS